MRRPACQVARRTLDSSTRCRLGVGVGARRSRGSPVEGTGGSLVVGMLDTSSAVGSRHSAMLCVCFEWRAVLVGAAGRSGTADWWGAPAPALHAGPPGVSSWAYRKGWFRRTPWAVAIGALGRAWIRQEGGAGAGRAQPSWLRARVTKEDWGPNRVQPVKPRTAIPPHQARRARRIPSCFL